MEDTFTFVVAIILLILLIADWTATTILFRASRGRNNIALTERARMAAALAIAASLNAALAVNRLLELHFGTFNVLLILSISLILGSVPNLYWLSLYFRNRLHK